MIPLVDLRAQYQSIKKEVDAAISQVIDDTAFIGGKYAAAFEEEFANALGVGYCVGVGNGTDALFIVLKALGVGKGDEVIVPANSFIATSEAVTATGAHVVFIDCSSDDSCIDVGEVRKKITPKTKAIMVVHLYGQPAMLDELGAIAREHNLFLVEDAAQAHFAEYKGKMIGTFGVAATFSFYPGKNLGAYGDAGAIVTNDEALAIKCRMLANHGRAKGEKYNHAIEGFNSRLDGMQATILSVKLRHLSGWTKRRQELAHTYNEALSGIPGLELPPEILDRQSVYHLYVIRTKGREALREYLKSEGIETGVHYPIGLPYLSAYAYLNTQAPEDFPVTYRLQSEILSLPLYPELTEEQQMHIIHTIKDFFHVSR